MGRCRELGREIRRELGIVRERGIGRWREIKIGDGDGKPELGRGMGRERERGTERKRRRKMKNGLYLANEGGK